MSTITRSAGSNCYLCGEHSRSVASVYFWGVGRPVDYSHLLICARCAVEVLRVARGPFPEGVVPAKRRRRSTDDPIAQIVAAAGLEESRPGAPVSLTGSGFSRPLEGEMLEETNRVALEGFLTEDGPEEGEETDE